MTRALSLSLLVVALWAGACSAQPETPGPTKLTVDPVMTKGPAAAPVTIVEFSDYE